MLINIIICFLFSFEKPFRQIKIVDNNTIYSSALPKWYDTIAHVALEKIAVNNQTIFINKLPENYSANGLKAFVISKTTGFYIFIDYLNKNEAIEIISHEIIHIKQYISSNLIWNENDETVIWLGEIYYLDKIDYDIRPWERESFSEQFDLSNQVKSILWD